MSGDDETRHGRPEHRPLNERAAEREVRRAAALRANLRRRKAQSRARRDAPADETTAQAPSGDADRRGHS